TSPCHSPSCATPGPERLSGTSAGSPPPRRTRRVRRHVESVSLTGQPESGARFEWGLAGAAELGRFCSVLVVVDVLSFTTALDVAVGRGVRVHPFPWD